MKPHNILPEMCTGGAKQDAMRDRDLVRESEMKILEREAEPFMLYKKKWGEIVYLV